MPAEGPRRRLLIVHHSVTGGARQMAWAALAGARAEDAVVTTILAARDADAADLLAADGYLFACPENLASMAGVMKDFFDRCYYPVLDRLNGRPYAAMICAGSDGEGHRLAAAGGGRSADHMHPRPDARGDPGAEGDPASRPGAVRGTRFGAGGRAGDGGILILHNV